MSANEAFEAFESDACFIMKRKDLYVFFFKFGLNFLIVSQVPSPSPVYDQTSNALFESCLISLNESVVFDQHVAQICLHSGSRRLQPQVQTLRCRCQNSLHD